MFTYYLLYGIIDLPIIYCLIGSTECLFVIVNNKKTWAMEGKIASIQK